MVSLTYIVPTISRPSLAVVLADLVDQLAYNDEVIVVGDGPQPDAAKMVAEVTKKRLCDIAYFNGPMTGCFGNAQRQYGMRFSATTHLAFVDDDDRLVRGAVQAIRTALEITPDRPHLFRGWYTAGLLWKEKRIELCNVSSQMIVVPNRRDRTGSWGDRYQGDFDFATSVAATYPDGESDFVWSVTVVAIQGRNGELVPHPKGILR